MEVTVRSHNRLQREGKCQMAEIVQYSCNVETTPDGNLMMHCFPIPRIFRICPGQPATEITKLVDIDVITGEVEIRPSISQHSIKGRAWRDVVKYEDNNNVRV